MAVSRLVSIIALPALSLLVGPLGGCGEDERPPGADRAGAIEGTALEHPIGPATVPNVQPATQVVPCEKLLKIMCDAAGDELCRELKRARNKAPLTEHDVAECRELLADEPRLADALALLEKAAAKRLAVQLQTDRAAAKAKAAREGGGLAAVPKKDKEAAPPEEAEPTGGPSFPILEVPADPIAPATFGERQKAKARTKKKGGER